MERVTDTIEIIPTPTNDWLKGKLQSCESRFLAASPFVGDIFLDYSSALSQDIDKILITRTNLRDFALGASNINTLFNLAASGVKVRSLVGLHAKIYIIDNSFALVTSANATYSGMFRNREFGVGLSSPEKVNAVAKALLSGLGGDSPPIDVTVDELEAIRKSIASIRPRIPTIEDIDGILTEVEGQVEFEIKDESGLLGAFTGWTRLTFEGVLRQPNDEFSLGDLFAVCKEPALIHYPDNRHVRAKLRQQLQRLRDYGAVEFIGGGNYRKKFS